ncbi:ABC transporter ATP-binding protein [Romeria aff. gracilis LEGE 07310]|uniref:ABC transporter ATP-binding protein n=1 Tax=Vasconcelosia minhoensis LEGE 07310 TaxID=915328 RepID=A0A8J7DMG9_9CYAN|nr:ABC transporter ATP-binding protein [Romeria gracilis]MBE9076640.1 ABC transporter ATP-binding protein [Romeria aff. gracilis LEGE 07310]
MTSQDWQPAAMPSALPGVGNPALSVRNITKRFQRKTVVNDIDLDLFPGEVYGLIGPNGAGKTTLMSMMVGAEMPTLGEIWIEGQLFRQDQNSPQLQRCIGFLPDDYPLYDDLTVWQYLEYFARLYGISPGLRHRRIYDILELVQLSSKHHSRTTELSRGMKQRLGLARAIIHQPSVLVLDEPVSGLDPVARMEFRDIIKALQQSGMTILISSHVLSDLADFCSTIGIMELGYLVESAPLNELYNRLSRRQIFIATLGEGPALAQALDAHACVVSQTRVSDREICVEFAGDEAAAGELLRSLIAAGIPLCQFNHTREDLETIFLKHLDHKQVS